ncbi:hypothetical protein IV102_08270 [bacterium]|nr:hypothetical protein [bacterium]
MLKTLFWGTLLSLSLACSVHANPMRFGHTTSPAAFKVDLPGSWALSKIPGCWEDLQGSRLQAVIAENAERTVDNTYPKWKKDRTRQGFKVLDVSLQGAPALIARGEDNCLGIILHKGYQVNLMLNLSNPETNMDDLLDQLAKTFQWLNP